jgi:hypothetical protein
LCEQRLSHGAAGTAGGRRVPKLSVVSAQRSGSAAVPRAGLCDSCAHQRIVRNTRGSSFSLCERSRSDPAYPRYPRVPVLACPGHTAKAAIERAIDAPADDPRGR